MGQSVKDSFGVNMSGVTVDALVSDNALREHLYMACLAELTNRGSHEILEDTPDAVFKCAVELFGVGVSDAVDDVGVSDVWDSCASEVEAKLSEFESDDRIVNSEVPFDYLFWFLRYVGRRLKIERMPSYVTADWFYEVVERAWCGVRPYHCMKLFTNFDFYLGLDLDRGDSVDPGAPLYYEYNDAFGDRILDFLIKKSYVLRYVRKVDNDSLRGGFMHFPVKEISTLGRCRLFLGGDGSSCFGFREAGDIVERPFEGEFYYKYSSGWGLYKGSGCARECFEFLGRLICVMYNLRFIDVGGLMDVEVPDFLDQLYADKTYIMSGYVRAGVGFKSEGAPVGVLCVGGDNKLYVDGGYDAFLYKANEKGMRTFLPMEQTFSYDSSLLKRDIRACLSVDGSVLMGVSDALAANTKMPKLALHRRIPVSLLVQYYPSIHASVKKNVCGLPFVVYLEGLGVYTVVDDYFKAVEPRVCIQGDPCRCECERDFFSDLGVESSDFDQEAWKAGMFDLSSGHTFDISDAVVDDWELMAGYFSVDYCGHIAWWVYGFEMRANYPTDAPSWPFRLYFGLYDGKFLTMSWDDEITFTGDMSVFDKYLS